MLDQLKDEEIVQKVGGRFKLSTLVQKRLVQLNAGSRPLVETTFKDKVSIVLEEVRQDKIFLDTSNELRTVEDFKGTGESIELDLGDL